MRTYQLRRPNRSYGAPVSGAFSNAQKATLCIAARAAWEHQGSPGTLEDWRREQQREAIGKASLRDCIQDDYRPLLAHFQNLAGESGRAMNSVMKHQTEPVRIARYKLREALAAAGLREEYAAAICRTQNKCGIEEASAKQLWRLVFTIRNRASAARRKETAPPPDELTPADNEPF